MSRVIFRKEDGKSGPGSKPKYKFVDTKGAEIKDAALLDYVNKLVIPPAYRDVKIFYQKTGQPKILYQGYDSKNRLQRIYSPAWRQKAVRKKFCELLNLAEQLPKITAAVSREMKGQELTKKKCIAMIIRMVMICYFRIGNKRYRDLYGSFGAMNIEKRHVKITTRGGKKVMQIVFRGKKGVVNSCIITDQTLIREMAEIMRFREPDEMIFQYLDSGVKVPVRAIDINFWLKSFDPLITSKDFRTYDSNIFLILFLREHPNPTHITQVARKKIIVRAMKEISEKIHNTPAILKKNYTQGGIVDMYIHEPERYNRYFGKKSDGKYALPRAEFIRYLRDYCRGYSAEKAALIKGGARGLGRLRDHLPARKRRGGRGRGR